jgi:ribose 5-phosphate isomerase B
LDCLKQWFDTCDTEGTSLEDKINNETGYFYEVTFRLSEIYPKINKLFNTYMEVYNCQYTFDTLEYREAKIEETLSLLTALSDHRGYKAKKFLKDSLYKYDVIDYGTDTEDSVDFPVYAKKLGTAIQNGEVDLGIAICGTGIGMSITLNKMKGVYCAKVSNESEAILCKAHNDANCIAMSEELDEDLMLDIVDKFINTPFTNVSKYIRRNDMIKELEK